MIHHPLKTIIRYGGIVLLLGIIAAGIFIFTVVRDLPDPTRITERPVAESTKIFDRTKKVLLYEIHGEENRTVIPFSDIPLSVKNATIIAEDTNFYSHKGIDVRGILRALYVDLRSKNIAQGGSTITQQLVKNTLVGKQQTLNRKAKEALLAILLETKYSKDEILNLYLNQIPYGSNAYGIEAAAETFFGKQARDLTIAESALLASLPRAPSYYSPFGSHKQELMEQKDMVLLRMKNGKFITDSEYESARKENMRFSNPKKNILAPHFVMYVRDYLSQKYDEATMEGGGLQIITTLDWDLQQKAESLIREAAVQNEKQLGAKNASLVAIDPKTGQILAMVGSRDYWETKNDGNVNVSTRLRQPGSSFKPFAYVTLLQKGSTADTVLFDAPTEFNPLCTPDFTPKPSVRVSEKDCYHPQNYDGAFRGPVTVRRALQQSLNVPSVEVLYLAGIEDTIKTAEALGISSLKDRSRFGLSLVLGGAEVKLLELVNAYGAFAQEGVFSPKNPILEIQDSRGAMIEKFKPSYTTVIDTEVVRQLNNILTDNEARVPVFVRNNSLILPDRTVAAKTGTTQDNRDAWTIGFTPSLVAGVWVGNNDNTPMNENTAGVLAAAPIWKKFMQYALSSTTPEVFTPPKPPETQNPILKGLWQGGTIVKIDTASKKAATDLTPKEFVQEVATGGELHSILYWINPADPEGQPPINPSADPQFPNWEEALRRWIMQNNYSAPKIDILPGTDDIHTEQNKPVITIPRSDTPYFKEELIPLSVSSTFPLQEITFQLDAVVFPLAKQTNFLFTASFPLDIQLGPHIIFVSAADIYGNKQSLEKEIIVHE